MTFNLKQHLKEMQDTLDQMVELNRLNRVDIQKWQKELDEKEKEKRDVELYKKQYLKLNKDKLKNKMKLMEINNDNNDIDDKLDYIEDIIGEHNKKKNKEIHLKLLQEYLSI